MSQEEKAGLVLLGLVVMGICWFAGWMYGNRHGKYRCYNKLMEYPFEEEVKNQIYMVFCKNVL